MNYTICRSSSSRPGSRLSNQQPQKKNRNTAATASQNSIGDGKVKVGTKSSKSEISKSGKDELLGVRKETQRIYTYKPPAASKQHTNSTLTNKKQSFPRQQDNSSGSDSSSSESDTEEQQKKSARSTSKATPRAKPKGPVDVLHVLKTGGNLGFVAFEFFWNLWIFRVF